MNFLVYLGIAAAIFGAGGAAMHAWDQGQYARKQVEQDKVNRQFERANRTTERHHAESVIGAINDGRKRDGVARAAADGARLERDGLRDELETLRAGLPGITLDACRKQVATFTTVFDQCAGEYLEMAKAADAHASDTLTLEQAWPR